MPYAVGDLVWFCRSGMRTRKRATIDEDKGDGIYSVVLDNGGSCDALDSEIEPRTTAWNKLDDLPE